MQSRRLPRGKIVIVMGGLNDKVDFDNTNRKDNGETCVDCRLNNNERFVFKHDAFRLPGNQYLITLTTSRSTVELILFSDYV